MLKYTVEILLIFFPSTLPPHNVFGEPDFCPFGVVNRGVHKVWMPSPFLINTNIIYMSQMMCLNTHSKAKRELDFAHLCIPTNTYQASVFGARYWSFQDGKQNRTQSIEANMLILNDVNTFYMPQTMHLNTQ